MTDGDCQLSDKMSDTEEDVDEMVEGSPKESRGKWVRHFDFVLASLGYAVGMGNIWRFPYLCMRNGGGAFLVLYIFFLLTCVIPLYVIEYTIGQYSSQGVTTVWKLSPIFTGIGWGMVVISVIVNWYYNTILAWSLYYLYNSFTTELPWASCGHSWNTESCYSRVGGPNSSVAQNVSNIDTLGRNHSSLEAANSTDISQLNNASRMTSAEEFWQYKVLQRSAGIDDAGGIRLELLICLVIAWILVLFCLIKGVKSLGKVVYVTATAPYVFLFVLLVRGALLPGSLDGIRYYITPRWENLLSLRTWVEASLQIFYSLGPAWGGLITMSSYNKFNNNCLRDAIMIPTLTCLTAFYAGFVIFTIVGFMAHEAQLPIEEVIKSGPGLVFVAYPEALSRLPIAPFWSVCFFIMLITVGLDSVFAQMETVVTGVCDRFPALLRFGKSPLVAIVCLAHLLAGIIFVLRAGIYYLQVVDWYVAVFSLPAIAFLECAVVGYVYGAERFYGNIEMMVGYRPSKIWKIFCFGVAPIVTLLMIVFNLYTTTEPTYGDYHYPSGAIAFGWIIAVLSFTPVIITIISSIASRQGSLLQRVRAALRPAPDWDSGANSAGYTAGPRVKILTPTTERDIAL